MDDEVCTCPLDELHAPHVCPFKAEINEDTETLCRCCEFCTQQCAWDI